MIDVDLVQILLIGWFREKTWKKSRKIEKHGNMLHFVRSYTLINWLINKIAS